MQKLDRLDIKLLACLQRDNQMTAERLAEKAGLSASAAARRVRRLRESEVIVAETAILAEKAVGVPLSAIVQLQLERHAVSELDALRRRFRSCDNIQICLEISGSFDLILLVVAPDMDSFNALMDDMLAENPAVRRYESSFVKRRVKASLALPLDQLGD